MGYYQTLVSVLGGSGGGSGSSFSKVNPSYVMVGDSISQFQHLAAVGPATLSVSRDATGLETWTVPSSAQIKGQPFVYGTHLADTSFEALARALIVNSTTVTRQTSNTTPGSTTTSSLGTFTDMGRFTSRGWMPKVNGLLKGSMRFLGNFGQNGYTADQMTNSMNVALGLNPDIVFILAGINDIYGGGRTDTVTYANVLGLINQVWAKGKFACILSITPVTTSYGLYSSARIATTQSVNSMLQTLVSGNSSRSCYADIFNAWYNGTACNPAYSADNIHPNSLGTDVAATPIFNSLVSAGISTTDILPVSSTYTPTVNNYTGRVSYGPWTTATGGTFVNSGTGFLPPGMQAGRTTGTATCVGSVVDPGDGKGINVNLAITGAAANDLYSFWPLGSSGATISTLNSAFIAAGVTSGLQVGDRVQFGFECTWSNANSANVIGINAFIRTGSGGAQGYGSTMEILEAGAASFPDSETSYVLLTGDMRIESGASGLLPEIDFKFAGASTGALNFTVRRITIFKL